MGCKAAVVPIYAAETAPTNIRVNQAARELFIIHVQNELTKIRWYGGERADELINELFPSSADAELSSTTQNLSKAPLSRKSMVNEHVSTYFKRLANLFKVPRIRRATTAAAVVMISQQLCGINVIGFYSGTILPAPDSSNPESVKNSNRNGLWLGWGSWMIGMLMAVPAFMTIDRWGRRTLCLFSTPVLGLCLFAGGFCFWLKPETPAYLGSLFSLIFLFTAFYPPEAGMSLAVFINLFGAGILSLFIPFLQDSLGPLGLFELFAGLNVIAYILIFVFVYETKQERLEKLDSIFDIPVAVHLKYQFTAVIPWCIKNMLKKRQERSTLDSLVLWNTKRLHHVSSDDESSITSRESE
ncbi:uncharacterized protein N0V89_000479 [Didymosphaeria variabile]|uniref:Major facilitator superfamily (MFS) profile domain-containing protein n=1 Tax=Didymosphaeria variabile TaxID=1932322 RepID=A0A9W8XW76_9PLEO|nr:uncharacterized protein N0V89_000479 [Didymosphaeria variabile]KAJ4359920.1 hypothetical protein N0V89_000479 [Didymosphaeria variabile]